MKTPRKTRWLGYPKVYHPDPHPEPSGEAQRVYRRYFPSMRYVVEYSYRNGWAPSLESKGFVFKDLVLAKQDVQKRSAAMQKMLYRVLTVTGKGPVVHAYYQGGKRVELVAEDPDPPVVEDLRVPLDYVLDDVASKFTLDIGSSFISSPDGGETIVFDFASTMKHVRNERVYLKKVELIAAIERLSQ